MKRRVPQESYETMRLRLKHEVDYLLIENETLIRGLAAAQAEIEQYRVMLGHKKKTPAAAGLPGRGKKRSEGCH